MGRSVSEAAAVAVKKGQTKPKAERTEEQRLRDLRNNLDAKLAVPPDDVRLLLQKYDELLVLNQEIISLNTEVARLELKERELNA